MRSNSVRQGIRLVFVILLITLCAGMIGYSARFVRHPVDQVPATELAITELSLTHEVERGADGKLTNPYAQKSEPSEAPKPKAVKAAEPKDKPAIAGPTTQDKSKEELKAKPAPKKPAPKKPAPKKPAPKKPEKKPPPKPPAKPGKACPT